MFSPHITSPKANDLWIVGTQQTVTWDVSDIPAADQNSIGRIVLGHIEEGSTNEHLDIKNPLAENFRLSDGSVTVTVPQVPGRNDYVVVLFGDSGNASPKFTINQGR